MRMASSSPAESSSGREMAPGRIAERDGAALQLTPEAVVYLQRNGSRGDEVLRIVRAQAAVVFLDRPVDEALAAVLLHGERRVVDRWRDPAGPLAMPNRRRPPPIVAAEEVVDIDALRDDLARVWAAPAPLSGVADTARLLGLRQTTVAEHRNRRHITRDAAIAA